MSPEAGLKKILESFADLFKGGSVSAGSAVYREGDNYLQVSANYKQGDDFRKWESLYSDPSFTEKFSSDEFIHESEGSYILCFSMKSETIEDIFILFESKIKFSEDDLLICRTAKKNIVFYFDIISSDKGADNEKYRKELINMRNMQAKLFPKFDALKGIDIGTVYLPASLMSGNFIDSLKLDQDIHQITICDISGYDAAASYAGAVIRTIVRSFSTKNTVPSAIIQMVDQKMSKIVSGLNSLIFLTICQINTKTGKVLISSFGSLFSIFYRSAKKGHIILNNTEVGRSLSKRVLFKDISITLEHGDMILFYSKGLIESSTEDGKFIYGEERLLGNFIKEKDMSSVEIVHSITDTLYEFTNYSSLNDDVILLCLKKNNEKQ